MTEVKVNQRSPEWYDLRQCVSLTASAFGEALGVGKGTPYDFLRFLVDRDSSSEDGNSYMQHGVTMEPVIDEAYQLLTGQTTASSGFWLPPQEDILCCLVGASPDAKVLDATGQNCIGLAEYKAPVHQLYRVSPMTRHGIPRHYMAQIQGQMSVTQQRWCDFMAVCMNTKDIMLKRVYFNPPYWLAASTALKQFCHILKEAKQRKLASLDPLDFPDAQTLRQRAHIGRTLLPGEGSLLAEDLLERDSSGRFRSSAGRWMSFEFLTGQEVALPTVSEAFRERLLQEVDQKIG